MPIVTLFQIPQVVLLHTSEAITKSTVMNRTDFNLFRGIGNEVEFLIKTVDRKPFNLTGRTLILHVVDRASKTVVLVKPLVSLNPVEDSRGHQRLNLLPNDIAGLEPGFYDYSIIDQTGVTPTAIYADQNRRLIGTLQICEGPIPDPLPQLEIQRSAFLANIHGIPPVTSYIAEAFKGAAQSLNHSGLHTVALYSSNFSGDFVVEASLENAPPSSPSDWFFVSSTTLTNKTGVTPIQFTGNYMWVRFTFTPAIANTGDITKLLFKS